MKTNATVQEQEQGEQAIADLDLSMVKMKLMDPEEGQGWTQEVVDATEREYKRFLTLNLLHPNTNIVPTHNVDKFWHQHILDTRQYPIDCDRIFGYFLHHFPYLGMRGPEDAVKLQESFGLTQQLYEAKFGEPIGHTHGVAADCDSSSCSGGTPNCGSSCGQGGE